MQFLNKPFTDIVKVGKKTFFTWSGIACFTRNTHFPPKQLYPRNTVNVEDRTAFVRLVLAYIWDNQYDYSEFFYSATREASTVICPKHGRFSKSYDNHVRGQGCLQCSRDQLSKERSQGFEQFVAKAKEVHGERYVYPEQSYKNSERPLTIFCRVHGVFKQNADNHVNKKQGCSKCSTVTASRKLKQKGLGGWSKDDYCKLSPKSNLYVIHMQLPNEQFYKIGISKNLNKRFNQLKRDTGVKPTLMLRAWEDAEIIWDLEVHLHKWLADKRYKPKQHFVGHTECFSGIDIQEVHKELLNFIEKETKGII